jgi:hypothetical protein
MQVIRIDEGAVEVEYDRLKRGAILAARAVE